MGRVLGVLLVLLLVAAGLAVGGAYLFDGRIRAEVESRAAQELEQSVSFAAPPTVRVEGYPIAWHLLTRRVPTVRVTGAEATLPIDADRTLNLLDVDVTLTDVSLGDSAIDAGQLDGRGRLAWAEVSRLAGFPLSDAGDGRVATSGSTEVLGLRVEATLTGVLAVDAATQTVRLEDPQVEVGGVRIPEQATGALVQAMVEPFPVPLPHGLQLASLTPRPDGLGLSVTGRDVSVPRR